MIKPESDPEFARVVGKLLRTPPKPHSAEPKRGRDAGPSRTESSYKRRGKAKRQGND